MTNLQRPLMGKLNPVPRHERAELLIAYMVSMTGDGFDEPDQANATAEDSAVSDILTDLLHWCRQRDVCFETKLATAQANYEAEK